jgi:hypothetical protein
MRPPHRRAVDHAQVRRAAPDRRARVTSRWSTHLAWRSSSTCAYARASAPESGASLSWPRPACPEATVFFCRRYWIALNQLEARASPNARQSPGMISFDFFRCWLTLPLTCGSASHDTTERRGTRERAPVPSGAAACYAAPRDAGGKIHRCAPVPVASSQLAAETATRAQRLPTTSTVAGGGLDGCIAIARRTEA